MKTVFLIIFLCASVIVCAQDINIMQSDTIAKGPNWAIIDEHMTRSSKGSLLIKHKNGAVETLLSKGTDSSLIKNGHMACSYIDRRVGVIRVASDINIPYGNCFYYADTVFSCVLSYFEIGIMSYYFVKCQKENGIWTIKNYVKVANEMEDGFRHGFNVVFLNENTVYARGSRTKIIKGIDGAMDSAISDPLYFIATLNPDGSVSRFIKQENDIPATPLK